MKLRKLDLKDSILMLEWMHDESVVKHLQANFKEKSLEDCQKFIIASDDTRKNLNLAIVDDEDNYMGTVSLKNIENNEAEFAITIRKVAMGKGYSAYGMRKIIKIGFEELNLKRVFWCVNPINVRAVKFYDKNGYKRVNMRETKVKGYTQSQIDEYLWYEVNKEDYSNIENEL